MRNRALMFGVASVASLAVAVPLAGAQGGGQDDGDSRRGLRQQFLFTTAMSGQEEVPAGDPNGYGAAVVDLPPGQRRGRGGSHVCFQLIHREIAPPTAAHIHRGRPGEAGPIVVTFFEGRARSTGCVGANRSVIRQIGRNPGGFYVNVHTPEFPAGAIRGQLERVRFVVGRPRRGGSDDGGRRGGQGGGGQGGGGQGGGA